MRALLEEYVPHVYRFALQLTGNRHQAEDLTQDTFVKACRHQRRLRDPGAVRVWLLRIAVNLWRDRMRQQRRRPRTANAMLDEHAGVSVSPEREATGREEVRRAVQAMDDLPARQREVLYLHAYEGLSPGQIAEILSISPDAAKASLSLARKKLRRQLKDLYQDRFPSA